MLEILIAAVIFIFAIYILYKNIFSSKKGQGCSNCGSCSARCSKNLDFTMIKEGDIIKKEPIPIMKKKSEKDSSSKK